MPGNGAGIHCICQRCFECRRATFQGDPEFFGPEDVAQGQIGGIWCFPISDFCLSSRSLENVMQEGSVL
jgi:hypothetical protein